MEKVRIGNDIQVKYTVLRDGLPESFVGATNIVVEVKNEAYGKIIPSTFSIVDNVVNVVLDAKDCVLCGKHRVTLSYNRGNDITIDALAFELVQFTSQTGGTEIVGVEIVTVNISGDIGIAIPDNNKIDLDGLNSNIDKLHFKSDTLVQLSEVGDVRYSPESKTLEVKVSDTVSIQLGQEMQTRVKNDAGVQIDNGQMVYINSASGANPLAKIASTTDADIAQRTFGMATENIASNGFGAITTEGLVRDVNTAAFTEGDMLWLGTNGAVTNIEPVAPTPKISVGMVLRSNVANGVIYVKIRAISRNQKLSDVYAPTLTGGDILRWNSTTLRFETFNVTTALAGKADLVGGKIPTSQLPAYVDDVLEYANLAAFPATGETGKIYVALDTNLTYRWSGTAYVEISKSLGLGETSSTAYRGDRGKSAYDHSQATGNAHGTTASQIPNTPAGTIAATTVQGAINELAGDVVQVETDLNGKLKFKADLLNGTVPAEQLPPDLIRTTLYLTQVGHRKRRIQDSLGVEDGAMLWAIVSGTEYLAALSETLGLGLYLVSQDLATYKKLNKTNSNLYADGTPANLDGTEGDIQMCWRKPIYIKYYEKQESDGLYEHIEISHLNILGECEMIVPGGGFPAVLNRTTGDLRALYSTDPNFRGGNNTASYDSDPVKTLIGKPATNLSAYSGEVAAKKRGALWTTGGTPFFATLAILQIMLFGTNHAQDTIVSDDVLVGGEGFQSCKKNTSGLYSGGFGVNNSFPQWSAYNAYNPTFDLSAGFSFGDITGRRVYIIKNWPTAGTNQTISLAYFFGMPYPFNHYWHGDAHQRVDQQTEAQGFKTVVYQKRDITAAPISGGPSANGVAPSAPWEKVAEASRTEGYIRRTSFNALCLIPTLAGSPGSSNKFYPDYFYNNGATSFGWRAPVRFANLANGSGAGPFYVSVFSAPAAAAASYGAFCCHFSSGIVPKKLPG
jgi:hypothetical protein